MATPAPLTLDDIRSTLATRRIGQHLSLHREIASTNTEAMAQAQAGAEHGTVVVAERQTAGRGRQGRTWFSPPGTNLYCSVLIRAATLQIPLADWLSWVPLTAAVAVAEAVHRIADVSLSLKWPNDFQLNGRKVGGILCESGGVAAADPFVVIGIGLNVNAHVDSFPPDLQPIASSLIQETYRPIDRNRLLAQWLLELEQALDELAVQGPHRLRHAYTTRCATLGQRVRVLLGDGTELVGTARAIGSDGALHVLPDLNPAHHNKNQQIIEIRAADVVHLRE